MKEYFSRLFIKEGSSKQEVKRAYRKLVKKFHPDKNIESNEYTEEFKLIQEAYEKLMSYFDSKQDHTDSYSEPDIDNSTKSGIVKSDAKFAEEGQEIVNDLLANILMHGLILSIVFFAILYIIYTQITIVEQILVGALIAPTIIFYIYIAYRKLTSRVNQE